MTIILHVGAGKCGSSSLQAHMSGQPLFSADDGSAHFEYVCVMREGELFRRDCIQLESRRTPYGCQVSAEAEWPWASGKTALEQLSSQFQEILAEGRTPIASQEAWLNEAHLFAVNETLPRLGLRAKVVVFVRPQIAWLNSCWWQWGAWSPLSFRDWVEDRKPTIRWAELIRGWQVVPGVDSVEIHAVTGDVVATFFRSLGVTIERTMRRNVSLDENLLNYLRRRTDIRPLHNPVVDFVLEQRLAAGARGTPWVMQQDQISDLIAYYQADNLELLSLLPGEAREAMEHDPMWWGPAAYSERRAVPAELQEPTIEALEDISARAIDAVIQLDARVRTMEESQRQLITAAEAAKRELAHAAEASDRELMLAKEVALRALAAKEAEERKLVGSRLRKAISVNGVRRLVGAKRAGGAANVH